MINHDFNDSNGNNEVSNRSSVSGPKEVSIDNVERQKGGLL